MFWFDPRRLVDGGTWLALLGLPAASTAPVAFMMEAALTGRGTGANGQTGLITISNEAKRPMQRTHTHTHLIDQINQNCGSAGVKNTFKKKKKSG